MTENESMSSLHAGDASTVPASTILNSPTDTCGGAFPRDSHDCNDRKHYKRSGIDAHTGFQTCLQYLETTPPKMNANASILSFLEPEALEILSLDYLFDRKKRRVRVDP